MADDLWRDCAKWLTRCNVLREDHKANWPQATHYDLAYTLRDGVLLCNLLNSLDPGSLEMKDVNQKPQFAQFLCLRNIKTFLTCCHSYYGLKESDLFEPSMLFDLTDFYRVLCTLSKLSTCPKLQKHNIPGFSVHKTRTLSQEDIYRNLNSSCCEDGGLSGVSDGDTCDYAHYDTHVRNEEIYQDLCAIDNKRTNSLITSAIAHTFDKRDYVINELVETEKNYVEVLSSLQKCFIRPLANVLKEDDFKLIFHGIKELYDIHVGFHNQLSKTAVGANGMRLSQVFLRWREKFLAYGDYCANLTKAQDRIQHVCDTNEFVNQEVMKCQQEANNGKFKLRDILSVPMQRILKYHLLLEKLISETQPNHEDFHDLERSKEAMVDVAQYINEVKRDSDTLQIMADIQGSITDCDITDLKEYGRLIKDGELRVKAHNDQKLRARYVFIFDKVMLMCKVVRGDQYSFKESIVLSEFRVEETPGGKDTGRWNHSWLLVRKSECTAYTLYARSEEARKIWLKATRDAMDNIDPPGAKQTDHCLAMSSFDKPTTCMYCSKYLKGIFLQGYKCDRCGKASHKNCIPCLGRCSAKQLPQLQPRPPPSSPPHTPTHTRSTPASPTDWKKTWTDHGTLTHYLWFVGQMGRDRASSLLEVETDGTFLLRIRPQGPSSPNETEYALSLKADNKVKHIKMYRKETGQYYLSESRFFRTIVELISFYEHASLSENFIGLDVRLRWPYQKIVAVAKFDFNPVEANQLPLKEGCQVLILSKEGDNKGWWKGKVQDRVGFFPKVYVREISDNLIGDLQ